MKRLLSPQDIPIHYYFFAWKKTMKYLRKNDWIYDPIEIDLFNQDLYRNLLAIKKEFNQLKYTLDKPIPYLIPKSMKDKDIRVRPMVQFSFRDQIAWATVTLALSEWFDTNDEIQKRIPLHLSNERKSYSWMVNWSLNNRIKRMIQSDELDGDMKRLFIHYNHSELYESYQWGLRNLREIRKKQFEEIRQHYGKAYFGEVDIKEFYPSLKIDHIVSALETRLEQLSKSKIINRICEESWRELLRSMLSFDINFDVALSSPSVKEPVRNLYNSILGTENEKISISILSNHLRNSLPIGLISAGFLSNCALTVHFDKKIDQFIHNATKDSNPSKKAFITRYTDDMMVIASDPELVYDIMEKSHTLLQDIGIHFSKDKCNPNIFQDNGRDLKQWSRELENKIPVINKRDNIPGSTAVIEKLSQFGDQKLWAMNHSELINFMNEMRQLLETNFDSSEIKDETKSVFAAWRVRSSAHEATLRNLPFANSSIKTSLRDSIYRYPHKFSFIIIYIAYLFENSSSTEIIDDLRSLMEDLKQNEFKEIDSNADAIGDLGAYLRTTFMYAVAQYWGKLAYTIRDKVNAVLFDCISTWYVDPPVWHEKAAMYWMLSVTNMKRDFGAVSKVADEYQIVGNMYRLFQVTSKNKDFIFEYNQHKQFDPSNLSILKTIIYIFRSRKNHTDLFNNRHSRDQEQWIKWYWDELIENKKFMNDFIYQQCVFNLMSYDLKSATVHGFKCLLKINISEQDSNEKKDFYCNVISLIDRILDLWIDYPNERKIVDRFMEAIQAVEEKTTSTIQYVTNRLKSLAWIKVHICKRKNGISKLPNSLTSSLNKDLKHLSSPTLLDWLSITRSSKLSQDEKLTHPLSEYEILTIFTSVKKRKTLIRQIEISAENWLTWRRKILQGNEVNLSLDKDNKDKNIISDNLFDPDLHSIDQIKDYVSLYPSEADVFLPCFKYSILLYQLYSHGKVNPSEFQLRNVLKWKGAQYVIEKFDVPSSDITALITSTTNFFYLFYKEHYQSLGNIQIPYRPFISDNMVNEDLFFQIIEQLKQKSKNHYLYGENGILEIRIENMDDWLEET